MIIAIIIINNRRSFKRAHVSFRFKMLHLQLTLEPVRLQGDLNPAIPSQVRHICDVEVFRLRLFTPLVAH